MANEILVHEVSNKRDLKIATEINGKATNLTVVLDMNGNKGLFSLSCKLTNDQITGISAEDQGTIAQIGSLLQQGIKEGKQWQRDWHKINSNGQLDMFDKPIGEDDESSEEILSVGTSESDSGFDVLGGKASSSKGKKK
jgi:hypothetical protein